MNFSDGVFLSGWACTLDDPNRILRIDVFSDGPGTYIGSLSANQLREAAVENECGGNPYQGFSGTINFSPLYYTVVLSNSLCVYAVYSDEPLIWDKLKGGIPVDYKLVTTRLMCGYNL